VISYADNAVMAKVRALYGKRLTMEDYASLSQAKSISDVASYLKNNTAYANTLTEVKEELVHRGQLETLVRRRNLNIYMSLLKYSYGDKLFLTMYMMENEIRQLLLAIRFLNANSMDRYIVALPAYLSRYMSFDLFALAKIRRYDDLIAAVEHAPYYAIITRYRPTTSDKPVDITGCEKALMEFYYRTLLDMIRESYSGDTRRSLERVIYGQIAFHNISVAYRLKKFFEFPPQHIRNSMLNVPTEIPQKAYDSIIEATSDFELSQRIRDLRVIKRFLPDWDDNVSEISVNLSRAQRNMSSRAFRYSVRPMVVVVNYMLLLEIEVNNVINIIEGIRYKLPADEIRNLIII
jgi:V/A-type H+-transporting ATPase subunit C